MKFFKKFFFYTDEQVKEKELHGEYSYENGFYFGFSLGVMFTIVIVQIIELIFS